MKIVHVTPFYGEQYGGSERYVCNLANYQAKHHEVHIFSTTRYFQRRGVVKIGKYYLHRFYAPVTIWNINPICFIFPKLLRFKADVLHVHSHLYFTSNQAIIASFFNQIPVILHLHGGVGLPPYKTTTLQKMAKLFYDQFVGKLMVKESSLVASVSRNDIVRAQQRYGNYSNKYIYLPNGVDTKQFEPPAKRSLSEKLKILYVGDMEPWKGVDNLLNVIESDKATNGRIIFQFVGQGSLTPRIMALSEKMPGKIMYLGEKKHSEIPSLMQNADMFIFPSKWEGTPTVILEAMSTGLPVISTDVGDVPLIISHKKNGFIYHHDEKSLKEYILLIQNNTELRNAISSSARKFIVENYDFQRIADQTTNYYHRLTRTNQ